MSPRAWVWEECEAMRKKVGRGVGTPLCMRKAPGHALEPGPPPWVVPPPHLPSEARNSRQRIFSWTSYFFPSAKSGTKKQPLLLHRPRPWEFTSRINPVK